MSEPEALHGLSCPRCGGMVPIPEGQTIVVCPFCDLRSIVRGENGVRRYQVPNKINREQASQACQQWLGAHMQIARDVAKKAQISEVMLTHLPFWAVWGRGMAWAFGQIKEGHGNDSHYEPREKKTVKDLSWNGAACDVGEFGVQQVNLDGRPLEVYDEDQLHRSGMVFEPVGSAQEALETAQRDFEEYLKDQAKLDRVSQFFMRIVRQQRGLVYYPLWIMRYVYHGRSFQVVVDGFNGEVLYGKAPGNVFYRAAVLVAGSAAGSFVALDLPALALNTSSRHSDNSLLFVVILFVAGISLIAFSYRRFRYGEHYEYQRYPPRGSGVKIPEEIKAVAELLNQGGSF